MQIFYIPDVYGSKISLTPEESKHAVRVLRLSNGDPIHIVDGKGGFYHAQIHEAHPKKCTISIVKSHKEFGKKDFHLHVAIAPTKNIDRFEWFLEKATEIGIDEVTPIRSEHSERKIIKPERLQKILIAAMKQSVKSYLPKLNPIATYEAFIEGNLAAQKFIAHCNAGEKEHLKTQVRRGENAVVLIGPEGDFSPAEVDLARSKGFQEISLGNSRLRTETAGIVATHIIALANE